MAGGGLAGTSFIYSLNEEMRYLDEVISNDETPVEDLRNLLANGVKVIDMLGPTESDSFCHHIVINTGTFPVPWSDENGPFDDNDTNYR